MSLGKFRVPATSSVTPNRPTSAPESVARWEKDRASPILCLCVPARQPEEYTGKDPKLISRPTDGQNRRRPARIPIMESSFGCLDECSRNAEIAYRLITAA